MMKQFMHIKCSFLSQSNSKVKFQHLIKLPCKNFYEEKQNKAFVYFFVSSYQKESYFSIYYVVLMIINQSRISLKFKNLKIKFKNLKIKFKNLKIKQNIIKHQLGFRSIMLFEKITQLIVSKFIFVLRYKQLITHCSFYKPSTKSKFISKQPVQQQISVINSLLRDLQKILLLLYCIDILGVFITNHIHQIHQSHSHFSPIFCILMVNHFAASSYTLFQIINNICIIKPIFNACMCFLQRGVYQSPFYNNQQKTNNT
eukprot:TRINITY_DN4913_c0_g1_i1.p1 TRINITY_DN4913_c0_g1~~TRINITY_DN4913_c0_g1_i1.p1  ORF type:complete len:257 (-),score=-13.25 TRINITY_DN4913_c0_g1_i1:196-966(-)